METVQQNRPEISAAKGMVRQTDERSFCDRLKTTRLSVELGSNYIVWSVFYCSIKSLKMCKSGLITAKNMSDPEIACTHLQNLIIQNNLVKAEVDLYLSIPDALLRCHYIPAVPKNELDQVVTWESSKIFPFTFGKAFYDWKIAETLEWGGSKKYEIQAAAIPEDRIRPIFDLFHNHSLKINRITFASLAWEEYLRHGSASEKNAECGNVALARLVGNNLTILFFHNHFLEFMRENNLEAGSLGGGFEESLRFLNEDDTSTVDTNLAVDNIKFEDIARDINDSLDYYYGQFSQRNINKILIAFPPAIQQSAVRKISELMGVEVVSAYGSADIDNQGSEVPINLFLPSGYTSAQNSRNLNLLPRSYRKVQTEKKRFRYALYGAGIILLLIIGISFFQQWQIKDLHSTARNLQNNLDQIISSPAYARIETLTVQEQNLVSQTNSINDENNRAVEFLKVLSNYTPSDIRLTDIDMNQNSSANSDNYYVDLAGFVRAEAGFPEVVLADYIKMLKQIKFIQSIKLLDRDMVLRSEGRQLAFNLELEID